MILDVILFALIMPIITMVLSIVVVPFFKELSIIGLVVLGCYYLPWIAVICSVGFLIYNRRINHV